MKIVYISLIAIFAFNLSATAQAKVKDQATIKVPGLHCDLDKDRIERSIFKLDGMIKYKIDVKRKTVFIVWLTDRTNIETLKTEIANTGYDADDIKAEESMRKRIPAACRVETVVPAKPVVATPAPAAPVVPAKPTVPAKPEVKATKPVVTTTKPATAPSKPAVTPAKPVVTPAKPAVKTVAPKKN
jgi:periplasmic mercuric ion binding protein